MPYPSFDDLTRSQFKQALKRADPTIFDDVLDFLNADPRSFGSGYLKHAIWKRIQLYPLTSEHIRRLEQAALTYLRRSMTPEFTPMCKTMAALGTPEFWHTVSEKMISGTMQERLNAACLYPYSGGVEEGERLRLAHRANPYQGKKAIPINTRPFGLYGPLALSELLHKPVHWHDKQVVRRAANPDDMPLIYYMEGGKHDFNTEFATLDMKAVDVDMLLPKLEWFLQEGVYGIDYTSWLYILYLMQQMEDTRVVPIVIRFFETRIDFKFESVTKSLLERSLLKVLRFYATPQALAVVEAHGKADQKYTDQSAGKSHGWVLSYP